MISAIKAHLASRHVSRVIYGAIIGLALVVALEDHPPTPAIVVATLLGTALAVGLAEIYSDYVGTEARLQRHIRVAEVRGMATRALAVASGVAFSAVFFILAAAQTLEVATAFTLAKWCGLALIGFYGFCAARLASESISGSALRALAATLIGAFLILLKALVH